MHDNARRSSTPVNNSITNNDIYGDCGGHVPSASSRGSSSGSLCNGGAGGCGSNWSGAQCPALSIRSGQFGASDDAIAQQAASTGLGMQMGVSVRSGSSTLDWAHHDWETRVINGALVVVCSH